MNIKNKVRLKKQNGAALLVSIVLIFMLSILGIAAMRDATIEQQLASNAIQKEITFQSAESATDVILSIEEASHPNAVESVICKDTLKVGNTDLNQSGGQITEVSIEYGGQSLPTGWSLGGPIGGRRFVVTGQSDLPGAATSTVIAQGVVAIGAVEQGTDC